jgi:hypothetical protein
MSGDKTTIKTEKMEGILEGTFREALRGMLVAGLALSILTLGQAPSNSIDTLTFGSATAGSAWAVVAKTASYFI